MKILNSENLSENNIWRDRVGSITKLLGSAAGSKKLYVNIDSIPRNAYSAKYHSHSQQEEFFLILSGTGTLRLNDQKYDVKEGDFFAKVAGENIAHTFFNSSDDLLVILDIGTNEAEDTCYYPDENIFLHKSNGKRIVIDESTLLQNWSSEANDEK